MRSVLLKYVLDMDLTENEKREFVPIIEKLSNCFSNWLPDIEYRLFKPKNNHDINDPENAIVKLLDECYQIGFSILIDTNNQTLTNWFDFELNKEVEGWWNCIIEFRKIISFPAPSKYQFYIYGDYLNAKNIENINDCSEFTILEDVVNRLGSDIANFHSKHGLIK